MGGNLYCCVQCSVTGPNIGCLVYERSLGGVCGAVICKWAVTPLWVPGVLAGGRDTCSDSLLYTGK